MARKKQRFENMAVWLNFIHAGDLRLQPGPEPGWLNALDEQGDVVGQWLPDDVCKADGVSKATTNGWLWVNTTVDSV